MSAGRGNVIGFPRRKLASGSCCVPGAGTLGRRTAKRLSEITTHISHTTLESFNGTSVQSSALTVSQARYSLTVLRLGLVVLTASGSFSRSRSKGSSSHSGATSMTGALGADGRGGSGHKKMPLCLCTPAGIANV